MANLESLPTRAVKKLRSDGILSTVRTGRDLISEIVRPYYVSGRLDEQVTNRGVTLHVDNAPIGRNMATQLYDENYESGEATAVEKYVMEDMDVIELGACLGFISCLSSYQISPNGSHVVVEPNPKVLPALKRTRDLNECDFEIIPKAYNPVQERIELVLTESAWSASTYRSGDERVDVETITLQTLIQDYDMTNLAVIVDIEGGEAELLESELEILESHASVLIIEFHDEKSNLSDERRRRIAGAKERLEGSKFNYSERYNNTYIFLK